jgi:uncharacterized membrane protein YfcA
MKQSAVLFGLGAISGLLGGLMGVGGGIVLVPLLVYALRDTQHQAQGTSLAFIIVTALVAVVPYLTHERLDIPLALLITAGAVPGVLLGARVAGRTQPHRLRLAFGVAILAAAVRMLASPPAPGVAASWPAGANVALGLFIGSLAGLLGVGGGTLLVPVLVLAQGVDQHTAQGISLLMIVPVGVVGMWSYARQGHLATARLPILLLGGAVGAWVGATGAHRVESALLTRMFATLLLVVGARMILSPSRGTVPRSADPMGDEK